MRRRWQGDEVRATPRESLSTADQMCASFQFCVFVFFYLSQGYIEEEKRKENGKYSPAVGPAGPLLLTDRALVSLISRQNSTKCFSKSSHTSKKCFCKSSDQQFNIVSREPLPKMFCNLSLSIHRNMCKSLNIFGNSYLRMIEYMWCLHEQCSSKSLKKAIMILY